MRFSADGRTAVGYYALISVFWLLTSTGEFVKYFHHKAPLFCVAGAGCIAVTFVLRQSLARRGMRIGRGWFLLFWLLIVAVYFVVYPITLRHLFGGGSDSENAMATAATDLLHWHFPYYRRTFLNNAITPMPGSLLLAIPFLLLGRVSYQLLLWLAIFIFFTTRYFRLQSTSLAFLVITILASAGAMEEFVVGADYLLNATYIAFGVWWLAEAYDTNSRLRWLSVVFLGIALSSRVIYVVVPPLIFAYLLQTKGFTTALRCLSVMLAIATGITLPFYLHDPSHFSPLHVAGKLAFLPHPAARLMMIALPALALLIACTGFLQRLTLPRIYLLMGLATGVMLFTTELLQLVLLRFSTTAWIELEYLAASVLFLNLWAFYRLDDQLVETPAKMAVAQVR